MAIPEGTVALALGAVLALGVSAVVLSPLWKLPADVPPPDATGPDGDLARARKRASAVEALREIEFDRATGKLSDDDYASLKASYTKLALVELRAKERGEEHTLPVHAGQAGSEPVDADAVETALADWRARAPRCATCGPRPEPDAKFCSECGGALLGRCPSCGGACEHEHQRFCAECGTALAAAV